MKINKLSSGFTLIEILVVVTIMAILTAIGAANFKVANQRARDGRRQGDLQQIRAALELYRTDVGSYPTIAQFPGPGGSLTYGTYPNVTTYMSDRPGDPKSGYLYSYTSSGSTYALCSTLELETGNIACGSGCGTVNCRYKVTNPL